MSNQSSEERISQKLSRDSAKNSKKNTAIIIIIIGIVIISIVALILLFARQTEPKRNVVVTPDNVDEILSDMKGQTTKPGTYEVKMNTTWNFDRGNTASSDAYVENSTSNTNAVDFDIVLSETGETIFKSPVIPVGSHLENITLDKVLKKGKHACVLTYHLLDDNGNTTGKLNLNLTINVKG